MVSHELTEQLHVATSSRSISAVTHALETAINLLGDDDAVKLGSGGGLARLILLAAASYQSARCVHALRAFVTQVVQQCQTTDDARVSAANASAKAASVALKNAENADPSQLLVLCLCAADVLCASTASAQKPESNGVVEPAQRAPAGVESAVFSLASTVVASAALYCKADYIQWQKRRSVIHAVRRCVMCAPWTLPKLVEAADAALTAKKDAAELYAIVAAVDGCWTTAEGGGLPVDKAALLRDVTAAILRGAVASRSIPRNAPQLFQSTSAEMIKSTVLPLVDKALLRERESALCGMPSLMSAFTVDLSFAVSPTLVASTLAACRSTKENERAMAPEIARSCAHRVTADALAGWAGELGAFIGDGGAAASSASRSAAAAALAQLAEAHVAAADSAASGRVLDALVKWLKGRESNEEARAAAMRALVAWLVRFVQRSRETHAAAGALVLSALERTLGDAALRATLHAFWELHSGQNAEPDRCGASVRLLTDFKPELRALGSSKKVTREDILKIFVLLSKINDPLATTITPTVLKASGLSTATEGVQLATAAAVHELLSSRSGGAEEFEQGADVLVTLAVGNLHAAVSAARGSIRALVSRAPELAEPFLLALCRVELSMSSEHDSNVDRLRACAFACAAMPHPSASNAPLLLLVLSHPKACHSALEGRRQRRRQHARGSVVKLPQRLPPLDEWREDACELLVSEVFGISSPDTRIVQRALIAMETIVGQALPDECIRQLLPRITELIDVSSIEGLSEEVVHMVRTEREAAKAAGQVEEAPLGSSSNASTAASSAKKRTGSAAAASARDRQALQAERDRLRAQQQAEHDAEMERKRRQEVTCRVEAVLARARSALWGIAALSRAAPQAFRSHVAPALLADVRTVSVTGLEGEACRSALYAMATCLHFPPPVQYDDSTAQQLAAALQHVWRHNSAAAAEPLLRRLHAATAQRAGEPLDGASMVMVAPLLRAAVYAPEKLSAGAASRDAEQMILRHVQPDAIESEAALELIDSGLMEWMVTVVKREDHLFATAADVMRAACTYELVSVDAVDDGSSERSERESAPLRQLLQGLLSGRTSVREATIEALEQMPMWSADGEKACLESAGLTRMLWLAQHDVDENVASVAQSLWASAPFSSASVDEKEYVRLVQSADSEIRIAAARATAALLARRAKTLEGEEAQSSHNSLLAHLFSLYVQNLPAEQPASGSKGSQSAKRVRAASPARDADPTWYIREGVAYLLLELARGGVLSMRDVPVVFTFFCARALGDAHADVRARMVDAAVALIRAAGAEGPPLLLPMIEAHLHKVVPNDATEAEVLHLDRTQENLVVCLGAVAGFLPSDEHEKVARAADQLIDAATKTHSESVQRACGVCLSSLAHTPAVRQREGELCATLVQQLGLASSDRAAEDSAGKVAERKASKGAAVRRRGGDALAQKRGAAYALSGLLASWGLRAMHRLALWPKIMGALEGKVAAQQVTSARVGALSVVETLSRSLQLRFEPYLVQVLPHLLQCMNDQVEVQQACWSAAAVMMSSLSGHGVRLVLPKLLPGLSDRSWRTKAGAARLLGAMTFCAPRQLSQMLPEVVPYLAKALTDAHPKVVEEAEAALQRVAAVTSNPEVRSLAPYLLRALRNPVEHTRGALDAMLQTEFVHAVDAASLALLVPPLHRALRDRSTELKMRGAMIVGSMCAQANEPTDILPYLAALEPGLRAVLFDPVPNVRRTSAVSLGALMEGLGEEHMPALVDWLLQSLCNAQLTTAERSGAANGLASVSRTLSDVRLNKVLQRAVASGDTDGSANKLSTGSSDGVDARQSVTAAREGALQLLTAMPDFLPERFEQRLSIALPVVLRGLADDTDTVREAAYLAGRSVVTTLGRSSLQRLLPLLCDGLQDDIWRIRQSSAQLLGDLLLSLAGVKATDDAESAAAEAAEQKAAEAPGAREDEDDEEGEDAETLAPGSVQVNPALVMATMTEALGEEQRNDVIAALYLVRNDVSLQVRMTSLRVWKSVVSNSPRVLREILPAATKLIVHALAGTSEERRTTAAHAVGDLAQKLGGQIMLVMLPTFQQGLLDNRPDVRRGACEGLAELVAFAPKAQLVEHADSLLPLVRRALCDELEDVRQSSANTFAFLGRALGHSVVERVVRELVRFAAGRRPTEGMPSEEPPYGAPKMSSVVSSDDQEAAELGVHNGGEVEEDDAELRAARAADAMDGLQKVLAVSGPRVLTSVVSRVVLERPLSAASMLAAAAALSVSPGLVESHVRPMVAAMVDTFVAVGASEHSPSFIEGAVSVMRSLGLASEAAGTSLLVELLSPLTRTAEQRVAGADLLRVFIQALGGKSLSPYVTTLVEPLVLQLADSDENAVRSAWNAFDELNRVVPVSELSLQLTQVRQALHSAAKSSTYTPPGQDPQRDYIFGLCMPKGPAPFVPLLLETLLHGSPETREQAALTIGEIVRYSAPAAMQPFAIKLAGPLIRVVSERFAWQVKAAILQAMNELLRSNGAALRMLVPQLQSIFLRSLADPTRTVRNRAQEALAEMVKIQPRVDAFFNELIALAQRPEAEVPRGVRESALRALAAAVVNVKALTPATRDALPRALLVCLQSGDAGALEAAAAALAALARRGDENMCTDLIQQVLNAHEDADGNVDVQEGQLRALRHLTGLANELSGNRLLTRRDQLIADVASLVQRASSSEREATRQQAAFTAAQLYAVGLRRELLDLIYTMASSNVSIDTRAAALRASGNAAAASDYNAAAIQKLGPLLVAAAREKNTMIKYNADRALRKMFLDANGTERSDALAAVQPLLPNDKMDWLYSRVTHLQAASESEDES